jgi:hypothetical protein
MTDVSVNWPGEPKDGRSKQAQSWVDAGDQLRNWWTSLQAGTSGLNAGARNQGQVLPPTTNPMEAFKYGNQFQDPLEAFKYGQPGDPRANSAALRGRGQDQLSLLDKLRSAFDQQMSQPFSSRPASDFLNPATYLDAQIPITTTNPNARPGGNSLLRDSWNALFKSQPPGGAATGATAATGALDAVSNQAPPQGRTIDQLIALASQYGPQRPNYDAVRQQLIGNTEQINNQIAAMYRRLGEDAQQNIQQIQDVYGGATSGIGAAYDTGTANIQDAYSSAQRQAAEQMARLGIEAAAPSVIDPMALSQAESVAGLEAGRAAGLSAAERYGATSGGFASQMGQVAQQEGVGYNQNLLAALQGQLGNLSMREAEANAQFNPLQSALQYLQLEQAMNPQADPRDAQNQAEFMYKQEQDDTTIFRQYYQDYYNKTNNQAAARELARADAIAGIMGPRIQQRAMSDPNFVPMASQ